MNYDIYVTNALTGNEELLPSNSIIITAEQIEKLLKTRKVKDLNELSKTAYGHLNTRCINRKTGDHYLKRGNKIIIGECNAIIPIAKNYNYTGIIYYETFEEEKFFLVYKLDPKDLNSIDKIQIEKTKYCIFNMETKKLTAITSYRRREKPDIKTLRDKKNLITNYIKNYPNSFTSNQIKNELINEHIIDKTEISLLLEVINELLKEGTIEYFVAENKEIFYRTVIKNKKLTKKQINA